MEAFFVRSLTEGDIRMIVEKCGGVIAHPDADRRDARGSDFIYNFTAIELKLLDEDGLEKRERQSKLASIFRNEGFRAPVVVLDRASLSKEGQRQYDRAIEGPIKNAIASARKQLKQTRAERPDTSHSILWIINNGYTALNNDELVARVAHRVRNDTTSIDGVVIGGCYFHSDGFDHFFLWPLEYVPIRLSAFPGFDTLRDAWGRFANDFMTSVVLGKFDPGSLKGAVVDSQFEIDGTTYVKPAPPIGNKSEFYRKGRPRKNSTGLTRCPPVALTFPGLSQSEWSKFRSVLANNVDLQEDYGAWLRHEQEARTEGQFVQPFVRMPITFEGWDIWRSRANRPAEISAIYAYANAEFQDRVQIVIGAAREIREGGVLPSRYIFLVTDEIGQDMANDLSHISKVQQHIDGETNTKPIAENLRIFHEYAIALASAYAVSEGLDAVMWMRNQRYAWA